MNKGGLFLEGIPFQLDLQLNKPINYLESTHLGISMFLTLKIFPAVISFVIYVNKFVE